MNGKMLKLTKGKAENTVSHLTNIYEENWESSYDDRLRVYKFFHVSEKSWANIDSFPNNGKAGTIYVYVTSGK